MFAHIIAPHNTTTYQGSKARISIAIGVALSCFALSAQAATSKPLYKELPATDLGANPATESLQAEATLTSYERIDAAARNQQMTRDDFIAQQTQLFFECTQVQAGAARLACFDKVAEQGKAPSYTTIKQPVDIVRTFKSTLNGNPKVVLADANAARLDNQTTAKDTLDTASITTGETTSDAQVLERVGVTQADIKKYTPLSLAYDLDQNSERGTWTVRPHNANYILPLFYTADPNLSPESPSQEPESLTANDVRNTDLKFQLSFKSKVSEDLFDTNADLWFGYTQHSHWQVYNEDNSRPFRTTDYQPEIFLTQPVTADLPFGGRLRMLGVGAVHHSNGQSDPLSRSWNRIYLMGGAEWGNFSIVPRVWARLNNEDDASEDNGDIEDFMGYGDIKFLYDLPKQQSVSGTLRYNPSTNKGAAQIDYIYPLTENANGYVQLFQGYGESIIDYNYENTAIGFGIVLNDWKGF